MFKKILEIVAKRRDSSNLITKILIKETFNVKKKMVYVILEKIN